VDINVVIIEWTGQPASLNFLRDTTARRQLETALMHAQKMGAVGTLAGGWAHDFNNLLQGIQGYTELLLLDKPAGDNDYTELQEISKAAGRGAELTRQLLTFSRKVESRLRPVNLNREVLNVTQLLRRTIPKMIRIELRLAPELRQVNADANQIEQVLMNLAVNANDAMPGGGRFAIETANVTLDEKYCMMHEGARPGEHVLLSVTDTGCGMDKETLEHIFEPFYTTKGVGKGTGLGLAMVYGIVKNHWGYITCSSKLGTGTPFKIYLPATAVAA
jgi:two-component system cell cycle sensor histidine kinase/response regulator CckA